MYRKTRMTQMRRMQRRERIAKRLTTLFIYTVLTLTVILLNKENQELKLAITEQEEEFQSIIFEKNHEITKLNFAVNNLEQVVDQLDEQIESVSDVNKSYVDELNTLRKRAELYDKYEYAIVYNDKRTDLTYEEIEYGENMMLAYGYDPDLMFGSIMVESRATSNAVNKESGATGYGQFLDSTAQWVWTRLLGNDTYHSDIRKDGKSNIQMMATYYDYLYNTKGDTFNVVKTYSGNSTYAGTARYLAKVNSFISTVGAIIN